MQKKVTFTKEMSSESSKKHWLNNVLGHRKKALGKPYKTCRLLIILGPFSEKGPQKYQKSIRFSLKVDDV